MQLLYKSEKWHHQGGEKVPDVHRRSLLMIRLYVLGAMKSHLVPPAERCPAADPIAASTTGKKLEKQLKITIIIENRVHFFQINNNNE